MLCPLFRRCSRQRDPAPDIYSCRTKQYIDSGLYCRLTPAQIQPPKTPGVQDSRLEYSVLTRREREECRQRNQRRLTSTVRCSTVPNIPPHSLLLLFLVFLIYGIDRNCTTHSPSPNRFSHRNRIWLVVVATKKRYSIIVTLSILLPRQAKKFGRGIAQHGGLPDRSRRPDDRYLLTASPSKTPPLSSKWEEFVFRKGVETGMACRVFHGWVCTTLAGGTSCLNNGYPRRRRTRCIFGWVVCQVFF